MVMIYYRFLPVLTLLVLIGLPLSAQAQMSSANFRIPSSVLSGGGEAISSANFGLDATLGQSSPLLDQFDPPFSANFQNFPGFWHTAAVCVLPGDINGDGIVNLLDFNIMVANWLQSGMGIPGDINGDGTVNLLDFNIMLANWLTSCP